MVSDSTKDVLKMWEKLILNNTYGIATNHFNLPIINLPKNRNMKKYYCETFDISELSTEQRTIVRMIFSKFKENKKSLHDRRCMTLKISKRRHGLSFINKLIKNILLYGEENTYNKKVRMVSNVGKLIGPKISFESNLLDYFLANRNLMDENVFNVILTEKDYKWNDNATYIDKIGSCSIVHIMLEE